MPNKSASAVDNLTDRINTSVKVKTLLAFWVAIGIASSTILVVIALLSNKRLADSQEELLYNIVEVESASREISVALNKFIIRQTQILSAKSVSDLDAVTDRKHLEENYQTQRKNLDHFAVNSKQGADTIKNLDSAYEAFIRSDNILMEKSRQLLTMQSKSAAKAGNIDAAASRIQKTADNISVRVDHTMNSSKRQVRRLLKTIDERKINETVLGILRKIISSAFLGKQAEVQKASANLRAAVPKLATLTRLVMFENTLENITNIKKNQINPTIQLASEAISSLQENDSLDGELHELVNTLKLEFNSLTNEILKNEDSVYMLRVDSIEKETQLNTALDQAAQTLSEVNTRLDELSLFAEESKNDVRKNITVIALGSRATLLTIGTILVFFTVVAGLLVMRRITKPLQVAGKAFKEMAQGDLTRRMPVFGKDEFAELSKDFNNFADTTQKLVSDIQNNAIQLASAAEELSTIAAQAQADMEHQQREITEAAASTTESAATVQDISTHSSEAAQGAEEAIKASESGKSVVDETIEAITNLANGVEHTTQVMQSLEQDSSQIGSVVEVIRNIAEQTNLLALNAAIEAARAGDQGRGFAVVADEVRTLAARTQESTQEIQKIIERFQSQTIGAATAMEESRGLAQATVTLAANAGESLAFINQSVQSITTMTNNIASAVDGHSSVAEEINRSMANIQAVSERTLKGTNQTASSSEQLSQFADELKERISRFKV